MHHGPGGYVDCHEQEIKRLCKGDDSRRDAVKWAARREPSVARQAMLYALLARRIPIIFSCRARELTEQRGSKIVQIGWQPTIHRELIYDITLSFTLRPEYGKGVIRHEMPFKLEKDHEDIFRDGDLITADHGARLMEVMRGGSVATPTFFAIRSDGKRIPFGSFDGWMRWWDQPITKATPEQLKVLREANGALIGEYAAEHEGFVKELERRLEAAISGVPAKTFNPPLEDDAPTGAADGEDNLGWPLISQHRPRRERQEGGMKIAGAADAESVRGCKLPGAWVGLTGQWG